MKTISRIWQNIQQYLFPMLNEEIGPLNDKQQKFVAVMELIEIGNVLRPFEWIGNGRKPRERLSLLKCFIAKSRANFKTSFVIGEYRIQNPEKQNTN